MADFLIRAYPWIKALHIISVVAWMAALLYLPRLFVYHSVEPKGSATGETFKVMERRLQRGIMNPAMIGTVLFGALLLATPGVVDWQMGWIHLKLLFVLGLLVLHGLMARWRAAFAADANRHSQKFFRLVNELPTLALVAIVLLVVAKPF
jgi:putative membrane protein